MATVINDTHLNNLINYLNVINTSFAQTNQIIYAMIGGTGGEVEVSEISMQTTETKELQIAALIEDISENLVWLTNTANSLFSIDLITLGSAEPEEEGTVGAPPQDPGGEKDE